MQINLTELFARDGKEMDVTANLDMTGLHTPEGDADGGRKRKAFADDSVQPLSGTGEGSILPGSCEDI